MDKEEIGRKAREAFESTKTVARKIGELAADLGKDGLSAAKEKIEEIRSTSQRRRDAAEAPGQNAEDSDPAVDAATTANRTSEEESDPDDIHFIIRGWLYFIWWGGNVVATFFCLWSFAKSMDSSYTRDAAWVPVVALPTSLLLNRLAYELAIAVFEGIKHLRQIRDELRRLNRVHTQEMSSSCA